MVKAPSFAVIGGSGLSQIPQLAKTRKYNIKTPYGKTSSPIIIGEISGVSIAFLERHGEGHRISPSEINYRANIYALKSIGIERVLAICACGSLREDYAPGDIVIPDDLFDFTKKRETSFFGDCGVVVHVNAAEPFCPDFSQQLYSSVLKTGATVHRGGSFITIEGPRFSTKAESRTYKAWGMSIIGMTASPEAFLAKEAQMCYSVLAMVTDYDVWYKKEGSVSWEKISDIMSKNNLIAINTVINLSKELKRIRDCSCSNALENTIATKSEKIDKKTRKNLQPLLGKYLK